MEVFAVAVDGRYNAEVRILRLFATDKLHAEIVTCFKAHREARRTRSPALVPRA
jgi:hypothetical protein